MLFTEMLEELEQGAHIARTDWECSHTAYIELQKHQGKTIIFIHCLFTAQPNGYFEEYKFTYSDVKSTCWKIM